VLESYRTLETTMERMAVTRGAISPERRRRLLQLIFLFVNLSLVEAHLPGPLWLAIGGIFWMALVGISVAGSSLVCGTMCWIGTIQDIFEPLARPRFRLDARLGRAVTFTLLVLWMPIGWLIRPELATHDRTPLDAAFAWQHHFFQVGLAALVAASVAFLGKRGICRYLCPFNDVVATVRRLVRARRTQPASTASTASASCAGCAGCAGKTTDASAHLERLISR